MFDKLFDIVKHLYLHLHHTINIGCIPIQHNNMISKTFVKKESIHLTKSDEDYLTRKEAQAYLGVSERYLHELANKGVIAKYKLGNKLYFLLSEIKGAIKLAAA
jgi:excisionase family DNA binding protein